jgi:membrane-associated phospholipid phosphatase
LIEDFKNRLRYLEAPDIANQIFLLVLSLIGLFLLPITGKFVMVALNLFLGIAIVYCVSIYEKKDDFAKRKPGVARFIRFFYPILMVLFCFKQIYFLMVYSSPVLYDSYLAKIDRAIFGTDPTTISLYFNNPWFTEFIQIIYGIFYLMPVIFAMELYLWHRYEELKYAMLVIFLGFYLSFLGYLMVPAIGPRFTIHTFQSIDTELPGIFFTKLLRQVIDFGESIPAGVPDPENYAQRDAFPSGHTIMIVLIAYLSRKIRSNTFYFYLPYACLMIFSTVYLRYHYVADLLGAIPFILAAIFIANRIYKKKNINFRSI